MDDFEGNWKGGKNNVLEALEVEDQALFYIKCPGLYNLRSSKKSFGCVVFEDGDSYLDEKGDV